MHQARALWLSFVLVAAGTTVFLCLPTGDAGAPAGAPTPRAAAAADEGADPQQGEVGTAAGLERTAVATGPELPTLPPVERAPLAVTGRVVDHLGNPIQGAKVRVQYRQSFGQGGPGFGNRGRRGAPTTGAAAGGTAGSAVDSGTDWQGFFGRNRGEWTDADRARMEAMRARFRPQDAADAVLTAADGHFRLRGEAFTLASLNIGVTHEHYAPAVEQREWQSALGELALADIVLKNGVVVTGTVVDDANTPLAGAEVRWERASEDDQGNGPGGFGGPGGRGNRGGRGNNGRGGFGNFGGFGGDNLAELIAAATTDASGGFRLGPVPADPFELVATMAEHLDGRSRRLDPADGQELPAQRIVAAVAAGIRGVVRDAAGQPVANARVTGEIAREAMMAEFRARRDAAQAAAATNAPGQDGTGTPGQRGGRRGRMDPNATPGQDGQGPGAGFAGMRAAMDARDTTRTNERGEFHLAKLPRALVKLTAEHRTHLTTVQEPIDAARSPDVVIVMPAALAIAGTVVDARTGTPLTDFGIAANRIDNPADAQDNAGFGGRGNRGGNGAAPPAPSAPTATADGGNSPGRGNRGGRNRGNQDPEAAATAAAQSAAQTAARDAWLQQQLGPTGRLPGRIPAATAHPGGAFVVDGLQAGEYSLDVEAPGYVRAAAQVVKLAATQNLDGLVVRVEPGAVLRGRVLQQDHTPIAGAQVELFLVEPPTGIGPVDLGGRQGPGGRGGRGGPGGGRGGRLARAETDQDGAFALAPQRPGTYRLQVQSEGRIDYEDPAVVVPSAGTERTITVVMTAGGVLTGTVKNLPPGVGARVTATHATDRSRHGATVDALSGAYTITGLPAGGYFVSLQERSADEDARRAMLGTALLERDKQNPDVFVAAGGTTRFDLVAGQEALGSVAGTVFLNGAPATGFSVRLNRTGNTASQSPAAPTPAADGGRGGNRLQDIADELLRTQVAADGTFTLKSIPPGSWQLEVQRGGNQGGFGGRGGRGGRGGNSLTHRQAVEVAAFTESRVQVELRTSEVEFKVTMPAGAGQDQRVRIAVVSSSEAGTLDPQEWRRLPSLQQFFLRDGSTGPQPLPVGRYAYQVSGRGIQAIRGEVEVAGGPQLVELTAVAAPETPAATPTNGQPGDPNQPGATTPGTGPGNGRGGRQGGGRQGGGRQGGGRQGGQGGNAPTGGQGQGGTRGG